MSGIDTPSIGYHVAVQQPPGVIRDSAISGAGRLRKHDSEARERRGKEESIRVNDRP